MQPKSKHFVELTEIKAKETSDPQTKNCIDLEAIQGFCGVHSEKLTTRLRSSCYVRYYLGLQRKHSNVFLIWLRIIW
jgi:hypothetical protein